MLPNDAFPVLTLWGRIQANSHRDAVVGLESTNNNMVGTTGWHGYGQPWEPYYGTSPKAFFPAPLVQRDATKANSGSKVLNKRFSNPKPGRGYRGFTNNTKAAVVDSDANDVTTSADVSSLTAHQNTGALSYPATLYVDPSALPDPKSSSTRLSPPTILTLLKSRPTSKLRFSHRVHRRQVRRKIPRPPRRANSVPSSLQRVARHLRLLHPVPRPLQLAHPAVTLP